MADFPPAGVHVSFSVFDIPKFDTNIISFGAAEQRISNDTNARYSYKIHFDMLSPTDINALIDFFVSKKGRGKAFTFEHPKTLEEKNVRFDADLAEIEYFYYQLFNFGEITLIGVDDT